MPERSPSTSSPSPAEPSSATQPQQSTENQGPQTAPTMDEHAQSYAEFLRMGDSSVTPTPTTSSPRSNGPSASSPSRSTRHTPASTSANVPGTTTPPSGGAGTSGGNAQRSSPSPSSPNNPTSSFFSSIFRKATTTLESSIQAAQQNGSEALTSAQQHMSAASSSAISTVSGLVSDIGTTFNGPRNTGSSSSSAASTTTRPQITTALKSLRLAPPSVPLLLFYAPVPTIVSQSALHIYPVGSPRPTTVPLNVTRRRAPSSAGVAPALERSPISASHAVIMAGPRLAVAHEDGSIVVFSLSVSRVAAFETATAPHPSPTTALAALQPTGLAVARRDGSVHLLNAALQPVVNLPAPDLCAAPLTPSLTTAAAVVLAPFSNASARLAALPASRRPAISVAYDDGSVSVFSTTGLPVGPPFFAHAGALAGLLVMFDAAILVTAGNATDRSIAVFDLESGRCLARRTLPFIPTCLQKISPVTPPDTAVDASVCPSVSTFLVGGDEAQVEVFRIVPLSAHKLDIKLVLNIGERQRGKKRSIVQITCKSDTGILSSVCESGDIRRWELSRPDAAQLFLLEEDRWTGATFTESNIQAMMERENSPSDDAQLNSATGVVRAQSILASILDDDSIPERLKEDTATMFQRTQAAMMSALSEAETEVRRARRRIFGRFSAGVRDDGRINSDLEKRLLKETRRAAAFEAEYVTRRYVAKVREVEHNTVEKLKQILTDFLNSLSRSNSLIVEQARRDVGMLGTEEAEVEVD